MMKIDGRSPNRHYEFLPRPYAFLIPLILAFEVKALNELFSWQSTLAKTEMAIRAI